MTARNYRYYQQADFRKGICDQQENLDPKSQVLDARNVWCPLGQLVRRPGYQAIAEYDYASTILSTGITSYVDTYTVYFGADEAFNGLTCRVDAGNTNQGCQFRCEYWNGSAWMAMDAVQNKGGSSTSGYPEFAIVPIYFGVVTPGQSTNYFWFVPPANWATTTVNSELKYWIRVVPTGLQSPSDPPGTVDSLLFFKYASGGVVLPGFFQFKYNQGQNFFLSRSVIPGDTSDPSYLWTAPTLTGGVTPFDLPAVANQLPATTAVIPEFNLAYVAYNNVIYYVTNTDARGVATVNIDPLIVGTDPLLDAPYRADLISQLPSFPEANLIINFRNLIFASGIKGQPTLVRWSGAVNEAAYNVWPETSFETLSTASDNSPITAMAGLGDNLVVFKQDSIWQLIFNGLDDLDLPQFIPQLVVAGVGCVAPGSIQQIRGRLIFLAEDGFYAFDGTPNIRKISDNVNETVGRINPGHRSFATAVNWRTKNVYICATALDESATNNIIFIYDYKHDAWWLWDDIPAEFLLVTSDTTQQEQVLFADTRAGIFKLIGETDNFGEIDSYVLSGRFGQDESMWKKAREVRVQSENIDGTIQYTLIGDDQSLNASAVDLVMNSSLETAADPPPPDGCDNVQIRRRERKSPRSLTCEWFQLKVEGFRTLDGYLIGYIPQSRR